MKSNELECEKLKKEELENVNGGICVLKKLDIRRNGSIWDC
jgi:hypothetical protein